MLIDFAHMNPAIFQDALEATKGPVFISHGNTCHHCPTPRNYTDEQLRAVADRGGIVGPFFAKKFLVPAGKPAPIDAVVAHFTHLRDVVGVEHMALGTDFGGILSGFAEGLTSLSDMPNLWRALGAAGFADEELELIAWKNAARFLERSLPSGS
jgi:membrane dipeptidase